MWFETQFETPSVSSAKREWVDKVLYTTAMTYRWALGWGRHPYSILSYLYQKVCTCWEVKLAGIKLHTDHKDVSGYY